MPVAVTRTSSPAFTPAQQIFLPVVEEAEILLRVSGRGEAGAVVAREDISMRSTNVLSAWGYGRDRGGSRSWRCEHQDRGFDRGNGKRPRAGA